MTALGTAKAFRLGLLDTFAMPFWMVFASMIGFGSMAQDSGVGIGIALGASVGIWGMPGQVAMIELFALGLPAYAIIIASSMANMRFMPMCIVMLPLLKNDPVAVRWRFALAHFMSINIWTAFMRRGPTLNEADRLPFYLAISLTCMAAGVLGTAIGYFAASTFPAYVVISLVFLNPAYFAFVFCSARQRNFIFAVIMGALTGPALYQFTPDWSLPLTGVIAGSAAFLADKWIAKRS